ncbi:hypothetical protein PoB_007604800 [Plakobranchus ocellatus]|uniref:Uncharacterized protein n=1 Tax=Plakobranchus ocellatus TaxID=259542 RepID=A0AAV4DYV4_9GAST|nr:hypothetical protein PoB_007604800 [Plakobranchus ocellatus]
MEVENKIDFSSDDEELMKFANMIDEACEQEDQIEWSPDEEEYDGDSVLLASYLNWVAKHKTRPEPQETELNEKASSPLHYTTLNRPTVCVEHATAETEVQAQNKDVDWDFLPTHVTEFEAKRASHVENSSSRRQKSKKWTLPFDVDNVAVCKTFFLDTLNISEAREITAIKKGVSGINFTSGDMRGRHHTRPTKYSIERDAVKAHVENFPTMESHYCRHNTQRRWLEADLSLQMMHKLYAES